MKKFLSPFNAEETITKIRKAKQQQKKYYNQNTQDLTELRKGDQVTVQPYGKNQYWKKATITEKFEYRRHMIELENGKRLVRDRRHLRLITRQKHSNMTETNCKQDITTNGSEENTKQQQPDMAERHPHLKRVTTGKTPNRYVEWQLTKV